MTYDIRVERLLNTTPELAFHQWISAEGRKQWYTGEQSDWVADAETDLRVGGTYWVTWGPIGSSTPWREEGTFVEVDAPNRLVYDSLATPPPDEGEPLTTRVTMTFEDRAGKTLVTLHEAGYPTEELRDMIEPFVVEGVEYFARSIPGAA